MHRSSLLIMCGLFLISCQRLPDMAPESSYVNVGDSRPSTEPDRWLMAHMDVETTGLIPGYHEMIDMGMAITDLDGNVLDTLFLRIQPEHPERLSPGAFAVNAFDAEKWQQMGALSTSAAVDSIIAFHKRVAGEKYVLFTAYNSQFDVAFVDHLFRSQGRSWRELYHYMVLDIPSMAWGLGFRDLHADELMVMYDVIDEPHVPELHTGITGALVNVRIYRAILKYQKSLKKNLVSNF